MPDSGRGPVTGACCAASCCSGGDFIQLTDRERAVFRTICESKVPIGFSAVKRVVGFHQEIVSRILRRLVNHGAVEKADGKYHCRTGQ